MTSLVVVHHNTAQKYENQYKQWSDKLSISCRTCNAGCRALKQLLWHKKMIH